MAVDTAGATLLPGDQLSTSRDGLELEVDTVRSHGDRLLVRFTGYPDRTSVEPLRGLDLFKPGPRGEPDGWWEDDLIGCEVVDRDGRALGTLDRVEVRDVQDLWIVNTGSGEVMVPAVEAVVVEVDLEARRIVLDPPDELF